MGSIVTGNETTRPWLHIFICSFCLLWLFHTNKCWRILLKYLRIITISPFCHVFQKQITYWILFQGISSRFVKLFSYNLDQPFSFLFWDASCLREILPHLQKCELRGSQQGESKCAWCGRGKQAFPRFVWVGIS